MRRPPTVEEALDELIGIAKVSGACGLALDAVRSAERFEQGRLSVAIVGNAIGPIVERAAGCPLEIAPGEAILLRDPRGICFTAGAPAAAWPANRRTDVILTDRQTAAGLRPSSRVRVLVVEDGLEAAFALIDKLACETGAVAIEAAERRNVDQLAARLQCHLYELQRGLYRSAEEMHGRINAISIVRVLAETVLDQHARAPDTRRARMISRLEVERTKFLMSTKADAVAELASRIAASERRDIRAASAAIARDIATDALAGFWLRASSTCVEPLLAEIGKQLVDDLVGSLGDLADALPRAALAGIERLHGRGFRRDEDGGAGVRLAHPLARRPRIEAAAREELLGALELGSRRLVNRLVSDADDGRHTLERRFCELVDGVLESVRAAAELARETRLRGNLAETRDRLMLWSGDLKRLVLRGEVPAKNLW